MGNPSLDDDNIEWELCSYNIEWELCSSLIQLAVPFVLPPLVCPFTLNFSPLTFPTLPHSYTTTGGYIELGKGYESLAAANFNRSFANAQQPFLVWTETPGGGTPNFLTGAGGFLQTAFQGYTGLRIGDDSLTFSPVLPPGSTTLALRGVAYLGNRLNVRYDSATITVELQGSVEGKTRLPEPPPCPLCMSPASLPRALRSQWGRVVMDAGHVVAPKPLLVIDASGAVHQLPCQLALQNITITVQ